MGIGTSAGGVLALQRFFESLPDSVDAAFVVIVHLDPSHQSELPAILAARTKMPVIQVTDRTKLKPKHVYVIPPNRQLTIADEHLSLAEFDEPRWQRTPIDLFFRSLAAQRGNDFAIVLTGAGTDGAVGIKAIKEAGGIILVQDPAEAEYASMPRSAIETGAADFILPVREIAAKLPELIASHGRLPPEPLTQPDEEVLEKILSFLRLRTGHDFSKYKKSTVRRRIGRRMQVRRTHTLPEYLSVLRDNAEEAQGLFADLLISVTTFFRDPGAFKRLAELVIPRLFEGKGAGDQVRVWIAGCATGEEAYSIAMLLQEEAERHEIRPEIQVFASDLDGAALATAREGRYPLAIEADMVEERLRRFFTRESDHFRVTRELRDLILFARHSLIKDPPFSRLDLASCRNVLIYLDRDVQQQICATLHFGLRPGGYLFLGSAESADSPAGLFRVVDRESHIYQRMPAAADHDRIVPTLAPMRLPEPLPARAPASFHRAPSDAMTHHQAVERLAPPSALVDESFRILNLSETAGRYIQPSGGALTNDVTQLAREEIRFELRAAINRVFAHGEATLSAPIAVRFNGARRRVYFQVKPVEGDRNAARLALVFFFEGDAFDEKAAKGAGIEGRAPDEQIRELQNELQLAQSELRASREQYEGANEELLAANEELQSINEEYRSTAEELETSKEELQSINEELQTVNGELKAKLESVSRAHSDIQNLMAATDVGILFLDPALKIKRFTPRIAELFNIREGDEGRTITNFTHQLEFDRLPEDAYAVLRTLASSEREVQSRRGNWFLMRLRPYRTLENKIDGVVVTFVDISERRRAEDTVRESEARVKAIINGVADAIVTVNGAGVVQSVNQAAAAIFGYAPEELMGQNITILMAEPYQSQHAHHLQAYLKTGEANIIGVPREIEGRRKDGSLFPMELMVSEIRHGEERIFIGFIRDLSEKRHFEERLGRLHGDRLASMVEMSTTLAHELNQPLTAATNYLKVARRRLGAAEAQPTELTVALDNAAAQMIRAGRIITHMREFVSRREPDKTKQHLHELIREAYELILPGAKQANIQIVLHLNAPDDSVLVDKVQIEQALVNLMRNAKEAMINSPERRLTISTLLSDGCVQTDVVDTGGGLPDAIKAHLFEPFATTKSNGLGVGLSISRSIIEAHYGKIWADSDPAGGTKFSFTLPLADKEIG